MFKAVDDDNWHLMRYHSYTHCNGISQQHRTNVTEKLKHYKNNLRH